MNAIGTYLVVLSMEANRNSGPSYPVNDPLEGREPRPGLRERARKVFRARPRVVREPGFAATHSMLSEFVPQIRAYPYPPTYR